MVHRIKYIIRSNVVVHRYRRTIMTLFTILAKKENENPELIYNKIEIQSNISIKYIL